jgi:hypothetical protein
MLQRSRKLSWKQVLALLAPLVAVVAVAVTAAPAAAPSASAHASEASAATAPFLLTFEGTHVVDPTLPAGLRHDGRFTASAPFCSAGRAYDTRQIDDGQSLTVWRLHLCDDGSGTFTAFMPNLRSEHGGSGTWQIVEGTGRYATLRGTGSYTGTLISGDPELYNTIVYRTQWQGAVDFDADPPAVEKFTATARKVRQQPRTYLLRVAVTVSDAGAPVAYTVGVQAGRSVLGFKQGSTASGQAAIALRIQPPRAARSARIVLTARDALGNEATASQSVRLR